MNPDVVRIARELGVKLYRRDTRKGPHWNGKTVALLNNGEYVGDSNTLHELAHWFVAAPERRPFVNFLLGASPEDRDIDVGTSVDMPYGQASAEELVASAVGIAMEIRLGMDWKKTAEDHNWHGPMVDADTPRKGLRRIVRLLKDTGIQISRSGIPQRKLKLL